MIKTTIAIHAVRAGLTALASIALFSALPAAASGQAQERVAYGDLDLTSDSGQATLNKRIRAAVKRVCGHSSGSTADFLDWRQCRRNSMADATRQMEVAIARAGVSRTGIAANLHVGTYPAGKR